MKVRNTKGIANPQFKTSGLQIRWNRVVDIGMVAVGVIGGPIGLALSISYFVADLATDGFHVSYEIKP